MKPASLKQKVFIAYLGHPDPENATSEAASDFIDMAMNSVEYQTLLSKWNTDKLRLHPDIYHEEVARLKASRFQSIFEFCEGERENYEDIDPTYWPLKKLTLKASKQAVEWLDAGYTGWDTELFDYRGYMAINEKVVETYFVPAIANVAPEFIKKERSGNPNPAPRQKRENPPQNGKKKKPKRKRGCLWWIGVLFLAWILITLVGAFLR